MRISVLFAATLLKSVANGFSSSIFRPSPHKHHHHAKASKTSLAFGSKKGSKDEEPSDPDDLSSMANVARKLQNLLESSNEKLSRSLETGNLSSKEINVATRASLQYYKQIKDKHLGAQRDEQFDKAGPNAAAKDIEGLRDHLDFADWAYLEQTSELKSKLEEKAFKLLKHDLNENSGEVGYYIGISPETKTALIGVKGTSSLQDMLTDCCGNAVTHQLDRPFTTGYDSKEITCHEGIFLSAKYLADEVQPFVENMFIPLNYKIIICGHSLGAGAACLLAVLLRSRLPALVIKDSVRVKAFASPPVLDFKAALACAPFVTTIANNSDIVTRASLVNVQLLLELLVVIYKKLEEKGLAGNGVRSKISFSKHVRKGDNAELLMSMDELSEEVQAIQNKISLDDPDHLCVPGKVLLLFSKWTESVAEDEGKDDGAVGNVYSSITTGDTPTLRHIEFDGSMITDHLTPAYYNSVNAVTCA